MKRKKFIAATLVTAVFPLIGKSFGMLNLREVGKGFKINKDDGCFSTCRQDGKLLCYPGGTRSRTWPGGA